MNELYWLSDGQMAALEPYFPKSRSKPRIDDLRMLSGIAFVHCNELRSSDAPREYGLLIGAENGPPIFCKLTYCKINILKFVGGQSAPITP